jgi:hypothetical protein
MASDVNLVNSALRKVGGKHITSMTESTGAAGVATDVFEQERDELLRSGTWNFATIRKNLAALTAEPVFEWEFAFAMPDDCMRIISVHNNVAGLGHARYKLESIEQDDDSIIAAILAMDNELWIRYVRKVTSVSDMPASFQMCLVLRMARIFAISIAKSNALYEAITKELESALRQARSVDGIEDMPDQMPEGSWVRARRGYRHGIADGWPWRT